MKERYFDDLKTGDRFKSEPLNVTVKEVVEFAHKFDPQMFHLSRTRAERSIFKGLIASGWHTAAMSMRLFVKTLNFAEGAIGLGVDELAGRMRCGPGTCSRWRPRFLNCAPHDPGLAMGFFACASDDNQRGEVVQTMLASAMVPKRGEDDETTDHKTTRR